MTTKTSRQAIMDKIEQRLDRLEAILKEGWHLTETQEGLVEANEIIEGLSKYWSVMNDEQTDFVRGAEQMIENRSVWPD
jgi:hypothetical protein